MAEPPSFQDTSVDNTSLLSAALKGRILSLDFSKAGSGWKD